MPNQAITTDRERLSQVAFTGHNYSVARGLVFFFHAYQNYVTSDRVVCTVLNNLHVKNNKILYSLLQK